MQAKDQPRKLAIQQGYFGRYSNGFQEESKGAASKSPCLGEEYLASCQEYGWQSQDL